MIHPTAIIHPKAKIPSDCEIGPFCTIGEHVELGAGCRLVSHVVIDGHTRLGRKNHVFPFASLGLLSQDLKWKGGLTRLEIGDENMIRESVNIHSATGDGETTVIGSNNTILANTHLGHNVKVGNHVIISMAGIAGHVEIEDHAIVGGMTGIHQFCRIGRMSIIGGCSRIHRDVAPYMLVEGNPAETRSINKIGLERNGVSAEAITALRKAHKILFRQGLTVANALEQIKKDVPQLAEVKHLAKFVRESERGVIT